MIYFVQSELLRKIKIGQSENVQRRLDTMQIGSPDKLICLKMLPGGKEEERFYHDRFQHLRSHGEWFNPGEDLLEFLEQITDAHKLIGRPRKHKNNSARQRAYHQKKTRERITEQNRRIRELEELLAQREIKQAA